MAKIEFTVTAEEKERIDEFVRDNGYSSRAKMLHEAIDYFMNVKDNDEATISEQANYSNEQENTTNPLNLTIDGINIVITRERDGYVCTGTNELNEEQMRKLGSLLRSYLMGY